MSEIIFEKRKSDGGTTKGFAISYNPDTREQGVMSDGADGGEETAIVIENYPHGFDGHMWHGPAYFILKGDFRAAYRRVVRLAGKNVSCWDVKRYYDKKKKRYGSRHSTDFRDWGKDGERKLPKVIA